MRPGKAPIVMLIIAAILALAAGVGTGFLMIKRAQADTKHGAKKSSDGEKGTKAATLHSLGEMVVNLADTGSLRYAKLSVAVGFEQKLSEEKLKDLQPVLRDAVIGVITNQRFTDLHQKNGPAKLKKQLQQAIQERVDDVNVVDVYLEAFAMQ
jgi:flagellar FliL protein